MTGPRNRIEEVHGATRLALDAVHGLTDTVEAMHHAIVIKAAPLGDAPSGRTSGITGLVYRGIRGGVRLLGGGLDGVLSQISPLIGENASRQQRADLLSILNGVVGDHLQATHNPLATRMAFCTGGRSMVNSAAAIKEAFPEANGKVLLLVHGLCMSDSLWRRDGHDHGEALARDLGYTPVYLRYNTGLHISTNGSRLTQRLEGLVRHWPVPIEELTIVGHSMGGLVARSAIEEATAAGHSWRHKLSKLLCLGAPHHGAPLERGGNWLELTVGRSPYGAPLARLGRLRSAGITDLRYGNLVDADWHGIDRFAHVRDKRQAVALPAGVDCYAMAATGSKAGAPAGAKLRGDGLVPVQSGLGRHSDHARDLAFPESHQQVVYGANHWDLLNREDVYAKMLEWLTPGSAAR